MQCGPVIGEASDLLADSPVCLTNLSRRASWERFIYLYGEVNPVDRNFTIAECVWHVRIQLGNDQSTADTRPFNGCRKDVDLNPETLPSRGTVVWTRTASTGREMSNRRGTSDRRIGR